ncbi:MAG: DUF5658 family protein [Sphaerochaeta sp.]|jgi:hypothetical protein|nr:DUF5658 family protein [Sphaerochaeta sp.]
MKTTTARILAASFLALQAADGFVTMWGTNHGISEANPILAPFAHTWGLPLFKIAFAALIIAGLALIARRFPRAGRTCGLGLGIMVLIQVGVMGLWGFALAS